MSYNSKEIPTGAINGVNTLYTLAHNIAQIDDVFVDGAIYLGTVTVAGATITLADAPAFSITVDYWDSVPISPTSIFGATTLSDIITEFYAIVAQESDSTVYPSTAGGGTYVENLANQVQDTICRER